MTGVVQQEARPSFFTDRVDAGLRLAKKLEEYRGRDVLVLGIPRGGVPVAAEVARHLDAPLDIVVARKLGAPISEELAIGAMTANGGLYLNENLVRELDVTQPYLDSVIATQRAEAERREEHLRPPGTKEPIAGRIVILVDDGLATGATMRAAARSVRKAHPAQLILAVPVGSEEACLSLQAEADRLVCLLQPELFFAVGLYYTHFEATEDDEVQRILAEAREAHVGQREAQRQAG
jgi:predicted phosphoribosyltransferase